MTDNTSRQNYRKIYEKYVDNFEYDEEQNEKSKLRKYHDIDINSEKDRQLSWTPSSIYEKLRINSKFKKYPKSAKNFYYDLINKYDLNTRRLFYLLLFLLWIENLLMNLTVILKYINIIG